MKKLFFFFLLILHFLFIKSQDFKVVNTTNGLVKGYLINKLYIWLGIPFAKPPIGELRYKNPEPYPFSKTEFEARNVPKACFQRPGEGFLKPLAPMSEDCLYLNIFAPEGETESLPVVIWIYGGGYTVGAASIPLYDPQVFSSFGHVVFVAIQYRVGSLGFLYTGKEAMGNMGLYDQVMAIRWVHLNIAGFGGDPNKITLMGQSAGANSVGIHILSNLTNKYFQRAIMQSSGFTTNWGWIKHDVAKKRATNLGKKLGCTDFYNLEWCLRNISADIILKWEPFVDEAILNFYPFVTVEDGNIIPKNHRNIMKKILEGKAKIKEGMSVLIGTNANEGYSSLSSLAPGIYNLTKELTEQEMTISYYFFINLFKFIFKDYSDKEQQNILKQYPPDGTPTFYFRVLDQMAGDFAFVCSAEEFAQANSKSGNSVYRYYYNHHSEHNPSAQWTGAMHGDELEFTFGVPFSGVFKYSTLESQFGYSILSYWTQFIKTGVPSSAGYTWPKYISSNWSYMDLQPNDIAVCFKDFFERCNFWINELHFS